MELITTTYLDKIDFLLGCYDRLVFTGTLPEISYAQGMTSYLYKKQVRIFDYPRFTEPFKGSLSDPVKHQELSDAILVEKLHRKLDELAWRFCSVYKDFKLRYHWSIMQVEYATDIVFKKQLSLAPCIPSWWPRPSIR